MRPLAFALALVLPTAAVAQPAPETDMVLLPRSVAEVAMNWIASPDPTTAVKVFSLLGACINDNPNPHGSTVRIGADKCEPVTQALAARDKQIADLQKQIADMKAGKP